MHKKVTPGCMAAALEIVNAKLFEATTHSPGQIVPKIKPNKHKREGGECDRALGHRRSSHGDGGSGVVGGHKTDPTV